MVSLLSSVSSQPVGKLAFLQLTRGSKEKEDAEFPNLLPTLLQTLSSNEESGSSLLFDAILGLFTSICDTGISLTGIEEPMTVQDVSHMTLTSDFSFMQFQSNHLLLN